MAKDAQECKIKIIKNGPYLVSGNIPLFEKIITPKGKGYEYKAGRGASPSKGVQSMSLRKIKKTCHFVMALM